MMHAVAVDDELPALKVIENFCRQQSQMLLKKTFTQPREALQFILHNNIDLLFLDINMPSIHGIEFYNNLPKKPLVIFTTAYSEFAVEGFNLNAVDYLLKPFTFERFMQSVDKAADFQKLHAKPVAGDDTYLNLKVDYSTVRLNTKDILFIEGLDDYLKIYSSGSKPLLVRMTMKAIAEKLPADLFIRVHRSYIVAIKHIQQLRNKTIIVNDREVPLGNSYYEYFMRRFNN